MNTGCALSILAAAAVGLAVSQQSAAAGTVKTEGQKLGDGTAALYVETADDGTPTALGIDFTQGMLEGLPSAPNTYNRCFDKDGNGALGAGECHGDYELIFTVPEEARMKANLPFKWISVNWNPHGHHEPAPPPWAAPHFDYHFYIQDSESVAKIRPGPCSELIDCDDFKRAQMPVPAKYVHADHIDVGAAVQIMGNHLIDSKAPELAPGGPPFTYTFIYGAYDGHITFFEPMITRDFLASRPDMCAELKLPQAWEVPGNYPRKYCIRYHAGDGRYTVSLEDFVLRSAD